MLKLSSTLCSDKIHQAGAWEILTTHSEIKIHEKFISTNK